jgi:hypothetical protein
VQGPCRPDLDPEDLWWSRVGGYTDELPIQWPTHCGAFLTTGPIGACQSSGWRNLSLTYSYFGLTARTDLRQRFGATYEAYTRAVPRLLPALRGYPKRQGNFRLGEELANELASWTGGRSPANPVLRFCDESSLPKGEVVSLLTGVQVSPTQPGPLLPVERLGCHGPDGLSDPARGAVLQRPVGFPPVVMSPLSG